MLKETFDSIIDGKPMLSKVEMPERSGRFSMKKMFDNIINGSSPKKNYKELQDMRRKYSDKIKEKNL